MSAPFPSRRAAIPIVMADDVQPSACCGGEPFALLVLGAAMAPEFTEGDVIVVEPDGLAADGAYVVAHANGEWLFRRLAAREGRWTLEALDPRSPPIALADLACVRGVVIQKSRPGKRRAAKRYGGA